MMNKCSNSIRRSRQPHARTRVTKRPAENSNYTPPLLIPHVCICTHSYMLWRWVASASLAPFNMLFLFFSSFFWGGHKARDDAISGEHVGQLQLFLLLTINLQISDSYIRWVSAYELSDCGHVLQVEFERLLYIYIYILKLIAGMYSRGGIQAPVFFKKRYVYIYIYM